MVRRNDFAVRADGGENDEVAAGAERADLRDLWRPETARKGELAIVGYVLVAEDEHRVFFEGRAHLGVNTIVICDIGEFDPTQFGGKTWAQWNDLHGRP